MRVNRKPSRQMLAVVVLAIAVAGFLTGAYVFNLFGAGTNCWIRPAGGFNTAVFTVVMADEGQNIGYNGSLAHGVSSSNPWPVMNVTFNQSVIIHVINNDSQAHGFTIDHYFVQGIGGQAGLAPGKCFDVRFQANIQGTFWVKCNIFCTIHFPYMQYGQFNVNP
jgi:hypothetical protein